MKDLLADLNPEQRRAVETRDGPVLVLAGAGTGKTRVITTRMAYLMQQGVPATAILAMTFTNKAAAEMRERIGALVGKAKAAELTVGTFHSFCARTLRVHARLLKLSPTFTICDAADQLAAVRGVLRELRSDSPPQPGALQARISLYKNRLLSHDEAESAAVDEFDAFAARAYRLYDGQLRRSGTLDFDDLLLATLRLLEKHAAARAALQERFRYVMVDEYQDTNAVQYGIVRSLAARHKNLCVVGDDDQSIYGWRGADVSKILNFTRDFPKAAVLRLETNYRSTHRILEAANAVIRHNPSRHEKTLRPFRGEGVPVGVHLLEDEEKEADAVVRDILSLVARKEARLGEFAILFRTQTQPRPFEAALRARGVRYRLVGGMSFFDRKEVRDLVALAKLVVNPHDEVSFLRVVNVPPRGIGKAAVERILESAAERGVGAAEAAATAREIAGFPPAAADALERFRQAVAGAARPGAVATMRALLDAVGYRAEVERCYEEAQAREARWAAVEEVLNFAQNYERRRPRGTLAGFLEELSLTAEEDLDSAEADRGDALTLMTLHAAKGLEFPRVYLVGVEEGLLPHARAIEGDGVEEERRLMYVGITRAQQVLRITHARRRARYGRGAESMPSRFLFEMRGEAPPPDWRPAGAPAAPRRRRRGSKA
ncbi:MAG: ATP-dependent helicase [Planctomycetaceae bacterium]